MPVPANLEFFIDPNRCIGCQACVQSCTECNTHRGYSMIQLDVIARARSPQTIPLVCLHCETPTCAEVCPADAIKRTGDGVVQSARKPRCIACNNCVLACPFGIPKMNTPMALMMKCDMCYDRTTVGMKPMCASVCPSQALFFGTRAEIEKLRPHSRPINTWQFGNQTIRTKVNVMVPVASPTDRVNVTGALRELSVTQQMDMNVRLTPPDPPGAADARNAREAAGLPPEANTSKAVNPDTPEETRA